MTDSLDSTYSYLDRLLEEDDWLPEGDVQRDFIIYATQALRRWFQQRSDVYVTGNLQLLYDPNNSRSWVAPDVFVVIGASQRNRMSYKTWEEGAVPAFVLETTSERTVQRDPRDKKQIYQDMGVLEYIQYDPTEQYLQPDPLRGYRLVAGLYQPIVLQQNRGIPSLYSEVLQLEVRLYPQGLRLCDPLDQALLRNHEEERQARIEAEQARIKAEQARIEAEQARIKAEHLAQRLAEQLRALGIDPDQLR